MSDDKKEKYADVPNYNGEISRVRKEIQNRTKAKWKGNAVDDAKLEGYKALAFDLEKYHLLYEASVLAKKQNREEVVDRLLKLAEPAEYSGKSRNTILNRAIARSATAIKNTCVYLGTLAATCAALSSTAADSGEKSLVGLVAGVTVATLSMYIHKKATQVSAHDALNKLKFYVNGSKDRM